MTMTLLQSHDNVCHLHYQPPTLMSVSGTLGRAWSGMDTSNPHTTPCALHAYAPAHMTQTDATMMAMTTRAYSYCIASMMMMMHWRDWGEDN
jgi:hypothetical protein